MSTTYQLEGQARSAFGTSESRRFRRQDQIPGLICGKKKDPEHVLFSKNQLTRLMKDPEFFAHMVELDIDGKKQLTVIKAVQRHPSRGEPIHVDFQRVDMNDQLVIKVPLHFEGQDISPGVKQDGGTFTPSAHEVEVRCMPKFLPDAITVDASLMALNDILHLSDLVMPRGVKLAAELDGEHNLPIAGIHAKGKAQQPETAASDEGDAA